MEKLWTDLVVIIAFHSYILLHCYWTIFLKKDKHEMDIVLNIAKNYEFVSMLESFYIFLIFMFDVGLFKRNLHYGLYVQEIQMR